MIRFSTAGESHGKALVAVLEGVPAGLPLVAEDIDVQLRRRMAGHGRSGRMTIESDAVEFLSGVRAGATLGSPIAMLIDNRDWDNWIDVMSAEPDSGQQASRGRKVTRPRPGHADLVGILKYDRVDVRDILERASARETAARVACGSVCRKLLSEFAVEIGSHVVQLGNVAARMPDKLPEPLNESADASAVRCLDSDASKSMVAAIDAAAEAGDTLGGIAEVIVRGLVAGLGSHVAWDRRLDGRLAAALMSIQGAKGVEIGGGFAATRHKGSEVHDEIVAGDREVAGGFVRATNRAGGLEGGMTTGEPLVLRVAMKPIPTLGHPLRTVNLETGLADEAHAERSDTTAVPAMGVIAEAMVALVLANAAVEKFGGDSLGEMRDNMQAYVARINGRLENR